MKKITFLLITLITFSVSAQKKKKNGTVYIEHPGIDIVDWHLTLRGYASEIDKVSFTPNFVYYSESVFVFILGFDFIGFTNTKNHFKYDLVVQQYGLFRKICRYSIDICVSLLTDE